MLPVVLSSNSERYPENQGGCFTSVLEKNLEFKGNTRVALREIFYEPDSWGNIRQNNNELTIKMKGYRTWAFSKFTVWYSGNLKFDRSTFNDGSPRYSVRIYRCLGDKIGDVEDESKLVEIQSDWMDGNPFTIEPNITLNKPPEFPWFREPEKWVKNACNTYSILIYTYGPTICKAREIKAYIKPNYYSTFPEFQNAFSICVHDAITDLFHTIPAAHTSVWAIPKLILNPFEEIGHHFPKCWIFIQEWHKTETQQQSRIEVIMTKDFYDETNFHIGISPILMKQLGLRLPGIFHLPEFFWKNPRKNAIKVDGKWEISPESSTVPAIRWYGKNPINFELNPLITIWVFCDIIESSCVDTEMKPLLRLMTASQWDKYRSFETYGLLQYKRLINNSVSAVKIWLTETYNGPPIIFKEPVSVLLDFADA